VQTSEKQSKILEIWETIETRLLSSADKRKRMARPKTLIIFGILFLLFPIINYLNLSFQYDIKFYKILLMLKIIGIIPIILLITALLIGIGLLKIKKWGFWLFLFYSPLLIIYNLYVTIKYPAGFNIFALAQALFGTVAIFYFLRKDISAPYMRMYPRGWRLEKRKPIQIPIRINATAANTKDISPTGVYVDYINSDLQPNEIVNLEFKYEDTLFSIQSGIVRIDPDGIGIAFRNLSREEDKLLNKFF
jgi:hypothetical protein